MKRVPTLTFCIIALALAPVLGAAGAASRPNVILVMADDLGWGDVGFNGNTIVQTPELDRLARDGVRLERFYAQAPSCSPTRASAMTGRNGYRFGVPRANNGRLEPGERSLAEMLADRGYATGHFGKWHLGTLVEGRRDGNRAGTPRGEGMYSPPWYNGFQVCFSTESKVPTWNPMERPEKPMATYWAPRDPSAPRDGWTDFGTVYWAGENQPATGDLSGCDSRLIMERALPFIRGAIGRGQPVLAVIWFHAPHVPVVAGPEFTRLYEGRTPYEQHYFGSITAMDRQIGRLRAALEETGAWENTLLFFGSDNGPESIAHSESEPAPGSAGAFRGRKRSLLEGGVRVPGIVSWPAGGLKPGTSTLPVATSDYLPSIRAVLGGEDAGAVSPIDGADVIGLLRDGKKRRTKPIAFEFLGQVSLIDNEWKLYSEDDGATYQLYNLETDPGEARDVASKHPERVARMRESLAAWRESCRKSATGADYRR